MSNNANLEPPAPGELVITRLFDAPRERVWHAWTDPEQIKRWWGPKNFTAPTVTTDVRVGGKYLYCMKATMDMGSIKKGQEFWSTGTYRELVKPERIVVTDSFADKDGNVVPPGTYGMPTNMPMEMSVTIEFAEEDGKTSMTLRHVGMPPGEQTGARQGWGESFDKLAEILK